MKMAEKKTKPKEATKKRDGGVRIKHTKSGDKIVKEKDQKKEEKKKAAAVKAAGGVEEKARPSVGEAPKTKEVEKEKPKEVKVRKEKPIVKIKNHIEGKIKVERKRKPRFRRDELYKHKKLKDVWRSPRGLDGKKKEEKRGKGDLVKVGYRNPTSVYGIIKGFKAVRVSNLNDMEGIDSKLQAIIISSAVGRRKRNLIIEEANKKTITVLNPRKGEV